MLVSYLNCWTDFIAMQLVKAFWTLSQYKDGISMYCDFHYKDKMVMRLFYLYNGSLYAGKRTFLYWYVILVYIYKYIHIKRKNKHSKKESDGSHRMFLCDPNQLVVLLNI